MATYYRVIPQSNHKHIYGRDNKYSCMLVKDEIYTLKEADRKNIPAADLEKIECSRKQTYILFGRRYELNKK